MRHSRANVVLGLGVASLVVLPMGPIVWVMGKRVVKDIDTAGYEGRSAANTGRVLGMVATALLVLVLLVSLLGGTSSEPTLT